MLEGEGESVRERGGGGERVCRPTCICVRAREGGVPPPPPHSRLLPQIRAFVCVTLSLLCCQP